MRAFDAKGIMTLVYLDDIFLLLRNDPSAHIQFSQAMSLIRSLGLPINYSKLSTPHTHAIWLGVKIDIAANNISIPTHKVQQLITLVKDIVQRDSITLKQVQSLVGRIAHIARVIKPARLFMSRILTQIRKSSDGVVHVNPAVKADLRWFLKFFENHNPTMKEP